MDLLKMSVPEFTTLDVSIDPVVDPAPTLTVPAEIVSAPVKVFVPDNVKVPAPVFVRPRDVPETTPDRIPFFELATCTVESAAMATVPESVADAVKFSTPADDTPVPEIVNGSAELKEPLPATCRVAPLATVVAPAAVPREVLLLITTVP